MVIELCEWATAVGNTQLSYSVDEKPSLLPDKPWSTQVVFLVTPQLAER
jgi:hypothetical protein